MNSLSFQVAGQPYKKFIKNQNKILKTWILPVDGTMFRVILEKDNLDIWVSGTKVSEHKSKFTIYPKSGRLKWLVSSQTKAQQLILPSGHSRPT